MKPRWLIVLWLLAALGTTVAGWQTLQTTPEYTGIIPVLIVTWLVTLIGLIPSRWQTFPGKPLRWLRAHPILYWLVLLIYICVTLGVWVVRDQPTNGRLLLPTEIFYLLTVWWFFLFLLAYDMDTVQVRGMGQKLGQSRVAGLMITLTTLVVLFMAAEAYLRIFYITTDGFGFTAMNYHWYKNFGWANPNSLGYRDREPLPDDLQHPFTRVAVVGDSFAMGHGINNVDDIFANRLQQMLGSSYDVNLIAKSGWDTNDEYAYLDKYPFRPNIIVWSYYLNDMNYLLKDPTVNPDSSFAFPQDPTLAWFILNFFVPNYVYYNLIQFTSPVRTGNHLKAMINAYLNDTYWKQQENMLGQVVNWTKNHNARLIVVVWPHLVSVDESTPATKRVREFFESKGIQVVDLTGVFRAQDPRRMIVNPFDAHPSIEAHRIAAEQIYAALKSSGG